jgi:GT2 family glycosyltransferase
LDLSILIATHGEEHWREMAWHRAYPSAKDQAPCALLHTQTTLAQARNELARLTTSEWLCFLDADDELDYGYVDAMSRYAHADVLLAPAVKYIDPTRETAPASLPNHPGDMRSVNRCVIGTLIRRETFWEQGGFSEWPCYEDWDLFLGAHMEGVSIVYVPDAVYKAHVSQGSRNAPTRREAQRVMHAIKVKHGLAPA